MAAFDASGVDGCAVEDTGYHIEATAGELGTVNGFLVDVKSWAIRKLVVATGHWYAGKDILIAAGGTEKLSYEGSTVFIEPT